MTGNSTRIGVVVLFALLVVSCDLLNTSLDDDFLNKIDDEIAWKNAAKLSVSVSFPQEWGRSPQFGDNKCGDVRKGYAFNVEFNPQAAYALSEWRAYPTAGLNSIANWQDSPADSLAGLQQAGGVVFPELIPGSEVSSFTINTTVPVTLIPWCIDQPRVVSTVPPMDAVGGRFNRVQPIIITFAAPIDTGTAGLGGNSITITVTDMGGSVDNTDYYNGTLVFSNGNRTITINPLTSGPPPDSIVTVTVGQDIRSSIGKGENGLEEDLVFFWYTRGSAGASISGWNVNYNANNTITVSWSVSGVNVPGRVFFYQNFGQRQNAEVDGINSAVIRNIPRLNDSNIRNAQAVSNIHQYDIYIEPLSMDGDVFDTSDRIRIWNIPGMGVSMGSGAFEIKDAADLAAMCEPSSDYYALGSANANKKFVLTNDISLTGQWTPIGTETASFQSIFYGNGYTISVNSGFSFASKTHTGIFGLISGIGAEIRDLAVQYNISPAAGITSHIGGIVGYVGNSARITNCIVTGGSGVALSLSAATGDVYMGGMIGRMEANAFIRNSFSDLNAGLSKNNAGKVLLGGIAGSVSGGPLPAPGSVIIQDLYCFGNVTFTATGTSPGQVHIGGIAGNCLSRGGVIKNARYGGILSVEGNSYARSEELYGGGLIGYCEYPMLEFCEFERAGRITVIRDQSYEICIGGITGYSRFAGRLSSCTARGDINVQSSTSAVWSADGIVLGGIAGKLEGSNGTNRAELVNCAYELGTISVQSGRTTYKNYTGGIVGKTEMYGAFDNCHSRAYLIEINAPSGTIFFGGFGGEVNGSKVINCSNVSPLAMSDSGQPPAGGVYIGGLIGNHLVSNESADEVTTMENCWSHSSINARGARVIYGGGLVGYLGGYFGASVRPSIKKCYATGNVNVLTSSPQTGFITYETIYSGGLLGKGEHIDISESFATGNVTIRHDDYGFTGVFSGGLAGTIEYGTIKNCYALGNATASTVSVGSQAVAGGIAGSTKFSQVQYCFAVGSVSAERSARGVYESVKAGGITGEAEGGTVSNNVSLASRIIGIDGNGEAAVARIIGNNNYNSAVLNHNYASMTMYLARSAIDQLVPEGIYLSEEDKDPTKNHGADAGSLHPLFGDPVAWKEADWVANAGFNSAAAGTGIWTFDLFFNYPRLAWE